MSPEQLNQSGGDQGYSGTAVDVWASGVLLIVMLVRLRLPAPRHTRTTNHPALWPPFRRGSAAGARQPRDSLGP